MQEDAIGESLRKMTLVSIYCVGVVQAFQTEIQLVE